MNPTETVRLKTLRDRNVSFTQYSVTGSHDRPEPKFNGKTVATVETELLADGFAIDTVEPRRIYFVKGDVTYRVDV